MICKRGDADCRMIGCDCYRTAPIEDVDAELREAGIDPEELVKLTNATLKLIHRNLDLNAALAAEKAKVKELVEALEDLALCGYQSFGGSWVNLQVDESDITLARALIEKYSKEEPNNE